MSAAKEIICIYILAENKEKVKRNRGKPAFRERVKTDDKAKLFAGGGNEQKSRLDDEEEIIWKT